MKQNTVSNQFIKDQNAPMWIQITVVLGVALLLYGVFTVCGVGMVLATM